MSSANTMSAFASRRSFVWIGVYLHGPRGQPRTRKSGRTRQNRFQCNCNKTTIIRRWRRETDEGFLSFSLSANSYSNADANNYHVEIDSYSSRIKHWHPTFRRTVHDEFLDSPRPPCTTRGIVISRYITKNCGAVFIFLFIAALLFETRFILRFCPSERRVPCSSLLRADVLFVESSTENGIIRGELLV